MNSYDNLGDALANAEQVTELKLDLTKGQPLTPDIERLVNLESLTLRGCPERFDVPDAVRRMPRLRHLIISPKDDKLVVPHVFHELPIEWLEIWDADVRDVLPMKHLRRLYFVTKNPKEDTALLARHLPQLVHLTLAGSYLKEGELPPDIARFEAMEVLELFSCGLKTLPDELARLGRLHTLRLSGLPMTTFPEVITRLEGLRTLQFHQKVATLPESLANLRDLVDLSLDGALNNGTLDAAYEPPPKYLKPLPPVLGKLTSLERLDLSACGVLSLDAIAPLTRLKSLHLRYAGLKDCAGLAPFAQLEELSLSTCRLLRDLSALTKLPRLRKLDLESCEVRDLGPIAEMKALEQLNIEYCSDFRSLRPVLANTSLQKLEADEEVLEKWNQRHAVSDGEAPEDLHERLEKASTPEEANEALLLLARYVQDNSTHQTSALAPVFGLDSLGDELAEQEDIFAQFDEDEADEDEVSREPYVALPALDALLKRFLPELSSDALAATVESTLRNIEHEVGATLVVVRELVRREDAAAQERVVKAFRKACASYDAGHRAFESTVHDVLIDELFPEFEPGPLSLLLAESDIGELSYDKLDSLFPPALENARDAQDIERLGTALLRYFEARREREGVEYFRRLLAPLGDAIPASLSAAFAEHERAAKARQAIEDDLLSEEPARVEKRIFQLGGEIPLEKCEEIEDPLMTGVRRHRATLSYEALHRYLTVLLELSQGGSVPSEIVFTLAHRDFARMEKDVASFQEAHPNLKDRAAYAVRNALYEAYYEQGASPEVLQALRQLASRLTGKSGEKLLREEVTRQLLGGVRSVPGLDAALKLLDQLPDKLELNASDSNEFASGVALLAEIRNFEAVCKLARQLPRLVLTPRSHERVLAQTIPSAIHSGNEEVKELCLRLTPAEVTWDILAFNLACLCALRGDKPAMLRHTRRAIELGKTKQQFLGDSDFEAYHQNPEFLEALKDG